MGIHTQKAEGSDKAVAEVVRLGVPFPGVNIDDVREAKCYGIHEDRMAEFIKVGWKRKVEENTRRRK